MARDRTKNAPAPRFEVTLNGRRLATAGVVGEGNLNAHLHWSRTTHYGEGPWATGATRLSVTGGDFNDPVWDRFRRWIDRPLTVGDHVEIRIVESRPDPGRPVLRSRRIPLDQYPSRRNPTAVQVRGVELFALEKDVLLSVGTGPRGTAQLSPRSAVKIARGLLKAADAATRRRSRRTGRRRAPRKA